jgi:hypothetical protein
MSGMLMALFALVKDIPEFLFAKKKGRKVGQAERTVRTDEKTKDRNIRMQGEMLDILQPDIPELLKLWGRYTDHPELVWKDYVYSLNALERCKHAIMLTLQELMQAAQKGTHSTVFRLLLHSILCSEECVQTQAEMLCGYVGEILKTPRAVVVLHECSKRDLSRITQEAAKLGWSVCATTPFDGDEHHRITVVVSNGDVGAKVVPLWEGNKHTYECVVFTLPDGTTMAGVHFPCGHGKTVKDVCHKLKQAADEMFRQHGVTDIIGDLNTGDKILGYEDSKESRLSRPCEGTHEGFDRCIYRC